MISRGPFGAPKTPSKTGEFNNPLGAPFSDRRCQTLSTRTSCSPRRRRILPRSASATPASPPADRNSNGNPTRYAPPAAGASSPRSSPARRRPARAPCLPGVHGPGDTLVVPALDRLGRSLQDLITTVTVLRGREVGFASLREPRRHHPGRSAFLPRLLHPRRVHPRTDRLRHSRRLGRCPRLRPRRRPARVSTPSARSATRSRPGSRSCSSSLFPRADVGRIRDLIIVGSGPSGYAAPCTPTADLKRWHLRACSPVGR
jgi:hypothetical protein